MLVNLEKYETVETARETGVALSIPSGALRHMFGVAPVFVSAIVPGLDGVCLEYEPGIFTVAVTDRFRLAVGELRGEHVTPRDVEPGRIVVPGKACADIAKALPKGKGKDDLPVSVLVLDGMLTVTVPGEWSRTINALGVTYPDWRALVKMPEGTPSDTFGINPHYMADAAKLVTGKAQPIKWHIGGERSALLGETTSPVGRTEVAWKYLLMQVTLGK